MTLLDSWMPGYEVSARRVSRIAAPPERVYAALMATDFSRPLVVRALMGFRLAPAFLQSPRSTWRRFHRGSGSRASLRDLEPSDFQLLEELSPQEIVLGIIGRFWTLQPTTIRLPRELFRDPLAPGLAQAAWNFQVRPVQDGTVLSTETRVRCADPETRKQFLRYWRLVAPGSSLIRDAILRQVRREAQAVVG